MENTIEEYTIKQIRRHMREFNAWKLPLAIRYLNALYACDDIEIILKTPLKLGELHRLECVYNFLRSNKELIERHLTHQKNCALSIAHQVRIKELTIFFDNIEKKRNSKYASRFIELLVILIEQKKNNNRMVETIELSKQMRIKSNFDREYKKLKSVVDKFFSKHLDANDVIIILNFIEEYKNKTYIGSVSNHMFKLLDSPKWCGLVENRNGDARRKKHDEITEMIKSLALFFLLCGYTSESDISRKISKILTQLLKVKEIKTVDAIRVQVSKIKELSPAQQREAWKSQFPALTLS